MSSIDEKLEQGIKDIDEFLERLEEPATKINLTRLTAMKAPKTRRKATTAERASGGPLSKCVKELQRHAEATKAAIELFLKSKQLAMFAPTVAALKSLYHEFSLLGSRDSCDSFSRLVSFGKRMQPKYIELLKLSTQITRTLETEEAVKKLKDKAARELERRMPFIPSHPPVVPKAGTGGGKRRTLRQTRRRRAH